MKSTRLCAVLHCPYLAESSIEDFPVCELHDCEHTKNILEDLLIPGHFWMLDAPIVVPCGQLTEKHFESRYSSSAIKAFDDVKLAEVPPRISNKISERYDLRI